MGKGDPSQTQKAQGVPGSVLKEGGIQLPMHRPLWQGLLVAHTTNVRETGVRSSRPAKGKTTETKKSEAKQKILLHPYLTLSGLLYRGICRVTRI